MTNLERDISNRHIEELGGLVRDKLLAENPILRPDQLAFINRRYGTFHPFRHAYRLWSSSARLNELMRHYFQHPKVLFLFTGPSATGKDTLIAEMKKWAPNCFYKIVTGTSRAPRDGEEHGVDYFFYNGIEALLAAEGQGELLEVSKQAKDRLYALPKQSLIAALARPEPVIYTHVEMSAWGAVGRFIDELYKDHPEAKPCIVMGFVMLETTAREYFEKWLPEHRADHESRAIRAGWELQHAPAAAHFLLTNVVDPTGVSLELEAKTMINTMTCLFPPGTSFPSFVFPPISPGIWSINDTLAFQNHQVR